MAKWANSVALTGGTDLLRARSAVVGRVKYHVLKAYAFGASHAAVLAESLGSVDMTAADFAASAGAGGVSVATVAAKSITLVSGTGASPDVHVAIIDSATSEVLLVNDETTNQVMLAGGVFSAPAWTITSTQPS